MNRKKTIMLTTFLILLGLVTLYHIHILPFIYLKRNNFTDMMINDENNIISKGDTISLLTNLTKNENLKIFIELSNEDLLELPDNIPKSKVIYCDDERTTKDLLSNFKFTYTDGDMATCESTIYILVKDSLAYKANIVISNNITGIQDSSLGWLEPVNMKMFNKILMKFKSTLKPIIII